MNKRQKKKRRWKLLLKANDKYRAKAKKDHPTIIGMLENNNPQIEGVINETSRD